MGMDALYYQRSVKEQRYKQAIKTIEEINEEIDKFYNRKSRTELNEEIDRLRSENLQLKQEVSHYKKIIDMIKLVQNQGDDDK